MKEPNIKEKEAEGWRERPGGSNYRLRGIMTKIKNIVGS